MADRDPDPGTDRKSPPALTPENALFLDFDGTLAPIAATPDEVQVPRATVEALAAASTALGGALAVVSGRLIADLDARLAPLRLPLAGCHGAERRSVDGAVHLPPDEIAGEGARIAAAVAGFAETNGLLLEEKTGAVALHYRGAAELEADALAAMRAAAVEFDAWQVIEGKMVAEARLADADKGHAVAAFMAEPPFAGRVPVFVGDDATDEDGFAAVQAMGGFGVKVGSGDSVAHFRLGGEKSVAEYLGTIQR